MKQTYTVPVKLSDDLLRKLLYIAQAEGRTPAAHFSLMLRNYISYFERAKGKIPPDALRAIDIEAFAPKSDEE
ncbi:MAG: hypothetical protein IKL84_05515 [Clostridia bacterium]|nr:hypothetical protein [Clostridia bacterium]